MKKKGFAGTALLLALAALVVYRYLPLTVFPEWESIEVTLVVENLPDGSQQEITEQVDEEKLAACLGLYKSGRAAKRFIPYELTDYRYEISLLYEGEVFHILAGEEQSLLYQNASEGARKLRNGHTLPGIVLSAIRG